LAQSIIDFSHVMMCYVSRELSFCLMTMRSLSCQTLYSHS